MSAQKWEDERKKQPWKSRQVGLLTEESCPSSLLATQTLILPSELAHRHCGTERGLRLRHGQAGQPKWGSSAVRISVLAGDITAHLPPGWLLRHKNRSHLRDFPRPLQPGAPGDSLAVPLPHRIPLPSPRAELKQGRAAGRSQPGSSQQRGEPRASF